MAHAVVGFLVLIVVFGGFASAGSTAEKTWSVEVPLREGQAIHLENLLGSIHVKGGKRDDSFRVDARVVVEGKSEEEVRDLSESIQPRQSVDGGAATLSVAVPTDRYPEMRLAVEKGNLVSRWIGSMFRKGSVEVEYDGQGVTVGKSRKAPAVAVHLDVTVPFGRPLQVDQRVGTIEVRHLRGEITLRSVEGRVETFDVFETLRVDGGSSVVAVDSFQGDVLEVRTADGEVQLSDVRSRVFHLTSEAGIVEGQELEVDDFAIESGSGRITIEALEPVRAKVRTASADVDLALELKRLKDMEVHSDTGNVVLRVRQQLGYDVLAETESGEVKALGIDLEVVERNGSTTHLRHGAGGPVVTASAGSGSVTVRPYSASRLDLIVGDTSGKPRNSLVKK